MYICTIVPMVTHGPKWSSIPMLQISIVNPTTTTTTTTTTIRTSTALKSTTPQVI